MKKCPLLEKTVADPTCEGCMYHSTDARCLHGVGDTTDFARARGVKGADVDVERVKAEQKIQAGLLLYEYLSWFRQTAVPRPVNTPPEVRRLLYETPLAEMGVTLAELVALAEPQLWKMYLADNQIDPPFRLAQVLLLTEQQYALIEDATLGRA